MRYKENWDEARERYCALWEGRCLDRPCIAVTAPRPGEWSYPQAQTPEQLWFDPEFVLASAQARMASTYWGGESIPSKLLMAGWVVCHGATPHFHWNTIWHEPLRIDWEHPPSLALDWDDPWLLRYQELYQTFLDAAGWDDFLVGRPCLLPGNDILVALMGNDEFLINLVDRPTWMHDAICTLAENYCTLFHHFSTLAEKTHAFSYGNAEWMTFWAPEPYMSTQSDVSCMLSPEMFDEFVLPELAILGREFGKLWYHLDGSQAFQHLPTLLSQPFMKVMQFVPEPFVPPNGPEWLDLYRRIQAAGVIVHVQVSPEQVEPLIRNLDPGLLCLDTWCGSIAEADELLASAVRWTRTPPPTPSP